MPALENAGAPPKENPMKKDKKEGDKGNKGSVTGATQKKEGTTKPSEGAVAKKDRKRHKQNDTFIDQEDDDLLADVPDAKRSRKK